MNRENAENLLKKHFHLEHFYDEQWITIQKLLKGEKVLLIEKTGFGKSLCFQFPAVIFPDLTIIFSPLIALMRDQVKKLNELGIYAACINSEQDLETNTKIMKDASEGKIKILYIAPERQENSEWIEATRTMKLSMLVVDEAHCISVWGHDFRPAFRRIINLVKLMPAGMPVLATTATATKKVEMDIFCQMGSNLSIIRGNLMRDNFWLFVIKVKSEDEKMIWLGQNLLNIPGSGIIYTGTRVNTEIYSNWLKFLQIPSVAYNAGLDSDLRINIEKGLINNEWKCVISTNALGMGIDKPDIRFIIHTQIPQSPVHYYQEIGRAGRDGHPAFIILFYAEEDKKLPVAFIEGGRPDKNKYEKVINYIKNDLLSEQELMIKTNLRRTQIRVIKADLIEQGIIREISVGRSKKYEYILNAPKLNTTSFEQLRNQKKNDLDKMLEYIETKQPRMKYLCDYLGDSVRSEFHNCDNTQYRKRCVSVTDEWLAKLHNFHEHHFPKLNKKSQKANLSEGIAGSYYGFSNVGAIIHKCKYENGGDFPDYLLDITLKAFRHHCQNHSFDLILYVPPTKSGDLVKNFAVKISKCLNIQISHALQKTRITKEQKIFENSCLKAENIANAFYYNSTESLTDKRILLIDDIFDSGETIKEIGKYLTSLGAVNIVPLVIAKTTGGDLNDN